VAHAASRQGCAPSGADHGAGKLDLDAPRSQRHRWRRRWRFASGGDDRNKPDLFLRRQNQRSDAGQPTPRIDLLRPQPVAARHRRHVGARSKRLDDDPGLVLARPRSSPADARDHL
jgi:hypothetical protein